MKCRQIIKLEDERQEIYVSDSLCRVCLKITDHSRSTQINADQAQKDENMTLK